MIWWHTTKQLFSPPQSIYYFLAGRNATTSSAFKPELGNFFHTDFFASSHKKKKNQKFIKDYCQTGPDVVYCWGSPCALLLALCVSFSYKIRKLVFFFVGITYVKAKYMSFMGHCDIKLNLWIRSRILAGIKVLAIYSIGNRNIW